MSVFGPRRGRALLVLPSLGLLGVIAALLFGLSARPVRSAEVYGGPTEGELDYSLRIHVQEEQNGVVRDVGGARLTVTWKGPGSESEVAAVSGEDGWVEVRLARPEGARSVDVFISDRDSGQVLAEGQPSLPRSRWQAASTRRGGRIVGYSEGPIFVEAHLAEAVLAYPFLGHLSVALWSALGPARDVDVDVEIEGAALVSASHLRWGAADWGPIVVRPESHAAALRLALRAGDGTKSTFYGNIPLVPGASSFERTPQGLIVRAPLPRKYAWYAFVTEESRLSGGRLPLVETKSGVSEGLLENSRIPEGRGRYLVVASSADGRSPSTVGYPLDGQPTTFDALDGRLLDGSVPAAKKEARRVARLRGLVFVHVTVVSLLTLGLFVWSVRQADRRLKEQMTRAGASELAPVRFATGAWIAALCLVGGFSLALVWISFSDGIF